MRAMIGLDNNPDLLVDIQQEYADNYFDFCVVNGCWEGTFFNGNISVYGCPSGDYSIMGEYKVISTDMNRLRGDYQTVFDNWHNPNYVAPTPQIKMPVSWDDDIPF